MEEEQSRRKRVRWIWLGLALVWTLVIWYHSMQTAVQSSAQSWWVVERLAPVLEWLHLPRDWWELLVRKAAHMTEFGILGLLWCGVLTTAGRSVPRGAGLALGLSVATAGCDEFIQLFVPGRAGMLTDVLIDSTGVLLAVLLYAGIALLVRRRRALGG